MNNKELLVKNIFAEVFLMGRNYQTAIKEHGATSIEAQQEYKIYKAFCIEAEKRLNIEA